MENRRIGKITRLGNSLAIVIPRPILRVLKMERGDQVVFGVYDENTVAIRKILPEELRSIRTEEVQF